MHLAAMNLQDLTKPKTSSGTGLNKLSSGFKPKLGGKGKKEK